MDHLHEGRAQYMQLARNTEWRELFMRATAVDASLAKRHEGRVQYMQFMRAAAVDANMDPLFHEGRVQNMQLARNTEWREEHSARHLAGIAIHGWNSHPTAGIATHGQNGHQVIEQHAHSNVHEVRMQYTPMSTPHT